MSNKNIKNIILSNHFLYIIVLRKYNVYFDKNKHHNKGSKMGVPREITNFFSIRGNTILLVKGHPGVGKTIFSLETLKDLKDFYGIYFSTRDIIDFVRAQIPWIDEIIDKNKFIDASSLNIIAPKEITSREAIELTTLPQFLKKWYIEIISSKKNKAKDILVVIDSIDALAAALNISKSEFIMNIKRLLYITKAKAIITEETEQLSKIDFMVDGVVILKKESLNKRILRTITFEKLRGIKLTREFYVFTLDQGHFYCFEKTFQKFKFDSTIKQHTPIGDYPGNIFYPVILSSGSKQFDSITGGFVCGSCILFTYAKDVAKYAYGVPIEMFIENFIMSNRHVIFLGNKSIKSKLIYTVYSMLTEKTKTKEYLHIISLFDELLNIDINEIAKRTLEAFNQELEREIRKFIEMTKSILIVLDIDHIVSFFNAKPEEIVKIITNILNQISNSNSLLILKTYITDTLQHLLEQIADYSFYVFPIGETHFIYGIKPFTPIYHIQLELVDFHPEIVFKIIS